MLTPLDIENKKFSKQMVNGYNVGEVDDFLDELKKESIINNDYEQATKYKRKENIIETKLNKIELESNNNKKNEVR